MALPVEVQRKLTELRRAPGEGDGVTLQFQLDYKRGSPPPGYPWTVVLTAPPAIEDNVVAQRWLDAKNGAPALLACLPPALATGEFLNMLTLACYALLVDEACVLVFGSRLCDYMKEVSGGHFDPEQFFAM